MGVRVQQQAMPFITANTLKVRVVIEWDRLGESLQRSDGKWRAQGDSKFRNSTQDESARIRRRDVGRHFTPAAFLSRARHPAVEKRVIRVKLRCNSGFCKFRLGECIAGEYTLPRQTDRKQYVCRYDWKQASNAARKVKRFPVERGLNGNRGILIAPRQICVGLFTTQFCCQPSVELTALGSRPHRTRCIGICDFLVCPVPETRHSLCGE